MRTPWARRHPAIIIIVFATPKQARASLLITIVEAASYTSGDHQDAIARLLGMVRDLCRQRETISLMTIRLASSDPLTRMADTVQVRGTGVKFVGITVGLAID